MPFRHREALDPDEPADLLPDRAHEGLALPQAMDRLELVYFLVVVAGVQVGKDGARLVPGRERDFDHVLELLARLLVDAEVFSRRAELAGPRGLRRPEKTARRHVDPQIVALKHADAAHLDARGSPARIPGRLFGNLDRIGGAVTIVSHGVASFLLDETERGRGREVLYDRDVDPDRFARRRQDELQARTQSGARARQAPPVLPHAAGGVQPQAAAEQLDFQFDGGKRGTHGLTHTCRRPLISLTKSAKSLA